MSIVKKKHKIDIFKILNCINNKDLTFFDQLSDDQQKSLQPLVLMRWMSGTNNPKQIIFLNEFVNPYIFALNKEKKLLIYSLEVCSPGKFKRYNWIKNSSRNIKMPAITRVIQQYFNYSSSQAIDVINLLSDDDIRSFADQLGYQPDEMQKINKELKSRTSKN